MSDAMSFYNQNDLRILDSNQNQQSSQGDNGILNSPLFIITIIIVNVVVIFISIGVIIYACKKVRDLSKVKITKVQPFARTTKHKYSDEINKYNHFECAICLESFVKNCEVTKIEACEHIFHSKCLEELNKAKENKLFRSKCPLCKIPI